jgi:hypothetical protein
MPVEIFDEVQRILGDQLGVESLGETLRALKGVS